MTSHHAISSVAALVGEPTRAAMLVALLGGRALPAGELSRVAGLSAAATSLHLGKLTRGGLLSVRQEGRHRYYRLASEDVARALEALGVIATAKVKAPALSARQAVLRVARTCYDHLAGSVAVALTQRLLEQRYLRALDERCYDVTSEGTRWFEDTLRIDVAALTQARRPLARACLDWTERRPHLAGALGAALLARLVELRWVRTAVDSRALSITPKGRDGFQRLRIALD
jgi:DNA-binding transcriptional ArsR family regulator